MIAQVSANNHGSAEPGSIQTVTSIRSSAMQIQMVVTPDQIPVKDKPDEGAEPQRTSRRHDEPVAEPQ